MYGGHGPRGHLSQAMEFAMDEQIMRQNMLKENKEDEEDQAEEEWHGKNVRAFIVFKISKNIQLILSCVLTAELKVVRR